ncbi:MAG TPA: CBS domain-containing protein [Saprospiraceae bacterium]|nr:CBS domain-containing protein [Saprospiraceae bacterium]
MDLTKSIKSIMSTDLKTAKPTDAVAVVDNYFKENRIHHVPVVNEDEEVVGVVSKSDFLYLLRGFTENDVDVFVREAKLRSFKVHEIMAKEIEVLAETADVRSAVSLLAQNRFRSIPVVDKNNKLVGLVTPVDILMHIDQA